ncbi:hypothetical protein ABZ915_34015 [Streptomyces sp. NPDC046915]
MVFAAFAGVGHDAKIGLQAAFVHLNMVCAASLPSPANPRLMMLTAQISR